MDQPKVISAMMFRSKTNAGQLGKISVWVHEDGTLHIEKYILLNEGETAPEFKPLCTKFGKTLCVQPIGFKLSSFANIYSFAVSSCIDNKINIKDVK